VATTTRVKVGPPVVTINKGSTFMVTDEKGEINPERSQGVFAADTRFVSTYRLSVNRKPWERIASAASTYHSAQFFLVNPHLEFPVGVEAISGSGVGQRVIPPGDIGLMVTRDIDVGVREEFEITNYGLMTVALVFMIEIQSDFADVFEVKAKKLRQRENLATEWNRHKAELTTAYRLGKFLRRFRYRVVEVDQPPSYANGRLMFPLELNPGQAWRACCHMELQHGNQTRRHHHGCPSRSATASYFSKLQQRWVKECTRISTPNDDVKLTYERSVEDMGALRMYERDLGPNVWVPAAGVPWYVALFGRDSLIASLQNMITQANFAEGALRILAQHQAHERDDWRDAQPGKIMHELRHGELIYLHLIPHDPYYGTWDATPLYLIALHQAWCWLGNRKLIEDLRQTALDCLSWIDNYGDLDGDGFQEYKTFSSQGYENMSWKDAGDAVVYADGSQVKQPKALCELQGYVYAAKRGMAEVFTALGDHERAKVLESQAAELKRRFNEVFWMENEGTFAFGLDAEKNQITSIASNAGHCLWTGIADDDKAKRIIERLLAPDMWSGWGIRTLSTQNPAYNPFAYQRGAIWPHDNNIIALGMKRYGFHDQANHVARGIIEAAAHFQSYRLPEVFAGIHRDADSFPVQYRGANIPQAWAAGSIFFFIQMMLGLEADAPNGRLLVNPTLPDWLSSIELSGLRVGKTSLDLRFWRDDGESRYEVKSQRGGRLEVTAADNAGGSGRDALGS